MENFTSSIQQIKPIRRGYAFTFKGEEATLKEVMQLIHMERKCCRFLRFRLKVSNEQQPLTLEITGPKGTRQFLQQMLALS